MNKSIWKFTLIFLALSGTYAHAEFPTVSADGELGGNAIDRFGVSGQVTVHSSSTHEARLGVNLMNYLPEHRSSNRGIPTSGFSLGGIGSATIWQNETSPIGFTIDARVSRMSLLGDATVAHRARLSIQEKIGLLYRIFVSPNKKTVNLGFGALYTLNFFGPSFSESTGDWYSNRSLAPVLWFSTQF